MAARLASYGASAYGEMNLPRPGMAVIAYTDHTDLTSNDPSIFTDRTDKTDMMACKVKKLLLNSSVAVRIVPTQAWACGYLEFGIAGG
jgi:hypothetical protein